MSNIIVSNEYKYIINSLEKKGYTVIKSETLNKLIPFEQNHCDIQCLRINDTFFVLNGCEKLYSELKELGLKAIKTKRNIGKRYPENVILNALYLNDKLYCKKEALDETVIEYCFDNSIEVLNVNQGYTKCSTAVLGEYFITADKGIFKALTENGVEGLLIKYGDIDLPGTEYGFIGGCCFYDNNTAFFTGNLNKYKYGDLIIGFLNKKKIKIEYLSNNKPIDIGGFIVI